MCLALCLSSARAQSPPQQQSAAPVPQQPADAQSVQRTPRQQSELDADLLMVRKQYSDAAVEYEKLVKLEPNNPVLLNKLGVAYHLQTRLEDARKYYEKAAKADHGFANAYNNLGTVYYQRQKYRRAVPNYIKAVTLDPNMSTAYSNMGYAYFHMKKYDESMEAFRRALSIDPEIFDRTSRGGSLLQDRTVLADKGLFYFYLAKSFAARGDAVQCARYLRRAVDEGYKDILNARNDGAFKSVLRDPDVRLLLQLDPLPPDPNAAPLGSRGASH